MVVTVGKAGRTPPCLSGQTEPAWLTWWDRGSRSFVGRLRGSRLATVPTKRDRPQAGSVPTRTVARGLPLGSDTPTPVRPHAGPKLRRRTSACRRGGGRDGVGSRRMQHPRCARQSACLELVGQACRAWRWAKAWSRLGFELRYVRLLPRQHIVDKRVVDASEASGRKNPKTESSSDEVAKVVTRERPPLHYG